MWGRGAWLVGLVALLAAAACGSSGDTSDGTAADPTATAGLADGRWSELPEPPLSDRAHAAVVWAGDRLVVWGGTAPAPDPPVARLDGATWTPEEGWRPMAPAPTDGGLARGGFAVWTGRDVVIGPVAGDPGETGETGDPAAGLLAYAPTSDRWRRIPPDPSLAAALGDAAGGSRSAAAVVAGEVVVGRIGGGADGTREPGRLVALDPATGRSRPLDPGPFDASPYPDGSGDVLVTPVGDRLLAVPNWRAEAWLLDPSGGGSWARTAPPPVDGLHLNGPVWTGGEAVFPNDGVAYDPATDGWRRLAVPPRDLARLRLDGGTGPIAAGDQAVARGAAYDTTTDAWSPLAPLPLDRDQVLLDPFVGWTGDALVLFGGGRYSCRPDTTCEIVPASVDWSPRGWLYHP